MFFLNTPILFRTVGKALAHEIKTNLESGTTGPLWYLIIIVNIFVDTFDTIGNAQKFNYRRGTILSTLAFVG